MIYILILTNFAITQNYSSTGQCLQTTSETRIAAAPSICVYFSIFTEETTKYFRVTSIAEFSVDSGASAEAKLFIQDDAAPLFIDEGVVLEKVEIANLSALIKEKLPGTSFSLDLNNASFDTGTSLLVFSFEVVLAWQMNISGFQTEISLQYPSTEELTLDCIYIQRF